MFERMTEMDFNANDDKGSNQDIIHGIFSSKKKQKCFLDISGI